MRSRINTVLNERSVSFAPIDDSLWISLTHQQASISPVTGIDVDISIYICVYVYVCKHIYVYMYVCSCIYIFLCICLIIFKCEYMSVLTNLQPYINILCLGICIYLNVIGTDLQNIPMSNIDNENRPTAAPHPDSLTLVIPDTPNNSPVKVGNKSDSLFAENYRIFFHMITQDHQLPDLIWNERTRSGPFVLICVAMHIFVSMYLCFCFCFCLCLFLVSLHFNSYSLSLTAITFTPLILPPYP